MNRFDKVRASVRGVSVEILAPSFFEGKGGIVPVSCESTYVNWKLKKEERIKIIGLADLCFNETTGELVLDFSGKLLPAEYRNLINKDNILKYLEYVNELGLIRFNAKDFLQKSRVQALHSTIDIQVEKDPDSYLTFLKNLVSKMESKFWERDYDNSRNLTIKRKTSTNKQSTTIYNKHKELIRNNMESALLRELLTPEDLEYFKLVLRFEQKLPKPAEIYQAFNITSKDNSLLNILHSDIYPVVNTLNTLFDSLEVPNA